MKENYPLSKHEFAQKMKEKREKLYQMASEQLYITTQDEKAYLEFLHLLGIHGYNAVNTLLIQKQNPQATSLQDVARWKEKGLFIKKGEKGIGIFAPGKTYTKRDGTVGVNINVKYLFDISQTSAESIPLRQKESLEALGSAFQHKVKDSNQISKDGLGLQEYLRQLLISLCRSTTQVQQPFLIDSAVYALSCKYGIELNEDVSKQCISYFSGLNEKARKYELKQIKTIFDVADQRIQHGLYVYHREGESSER